MQLTAVPCHRFLGCLALLLIGFMMFPGTGHAHTRLVTSEPENGAVLEDSPRQVILEFSAPPESGFTGIQLNSPTSAEWQPLEVTQRSTQVKANLPELAPGRYKIRWSVLSRDGHRQRGVLEFQIH